MTAWSPASQRRALAAVSSKGAMLHCVSESPQSDRDIVATALKNRGWSFKFASSSLRDNRDVVLLAIFQEPTSLMQFIDPVAFDLVKLPYGGRRQRCSRARSIISLRHAAMASALRCEMGKCLQQLPLGSLSPCPRGPAA